MYLGYFQKYVNHAPPLLLCPPRFSEDQLSVQLVCPTVYWANCLSMRVMSWP